MRDMKILFVVYFVPVSYTHLDVYKRQVLSSFFTVIVLNNNNNLTASKNNTSGTQSISINREGKSTNVYQACLLYTSRWV